MKRPWSCFRLIGMALLTASFQAQEMRAAVLSPVHWSIPAMPARSVDPGAGFSITVLARIDPGWHLYALEEPEGGPIATQIGLPEGDPLELLGVDEPPPHMVEDRTLHASTGQFTEEARFTMRVRAPRSRPTAETTSRVMVRYQSCNDKVCLPPHTETLTVPLATLLK